MYTCVQGLENATARDRLGLARHEGLRRLLAGRRGEHRCVLHRARVETDSEAVDAPLTVADPSGGDIRAG